jgi:sugar phosphate isomerase/epimerase
MPETDPPDLTRLAIHTMTSKPWSLAQCIEGYAAAGVGAISIWRNVLAPVGAAEAAKMLDAAGMAVPALVRGGFFVADAAEQRQAAIDENKRIIEEAATIGAANVVLVVGAAPGIPLDQARQQVTDGIAAIADDAAAASVNLAIEPLHPMYADNRSCVNTMTQARQICETLDHPSVGIACDVYHCWWDDRLEDEIALVGEQGRLFDFHICDWRIEPRHILTDRGLMGDGCIDVPRLRRCVDAAGYTGYRGVEVFSEDYWAMDQREYVDLIVDRYQRYT